MCYDGSVEEGEEIALLSIGASHGRTSAPILACGIAGTLERAKMSTGKRRSFYKSKAWERTRDAYAASRAGLCERCAAQGLIVPGVIVHHKRYLTDDLVDDPAVALGWDNLELLCAECHNKEHHSERRWSIGADGCVVLQG